MYFGMALIYAGSAVGFDGPVAFALLPLVLIAIQTQVIAREERYLEAKFGDDYRRYKARFAAGSNYSAAACGTSAFRGASLADQWIRKAIDFDAETAQFSNINLYINSLTRFRASEWE
jgi:hypothetical protein